MARKCLWALLVVLLPMGTHAADDGLRMYYGLVRIADTGGAVVEVAGSKGSLYGVLGAHQSSGGFQHQDITFILGARRYLDGDYDSSNYFTGLMVGDLEPTGSGPRYGIGPEFGYQLVKTYVRATFSGTFALLEKIEEGEEGEEGEVREPRDVEPSLLLGFSISLRK